MQGTFDFSTINYHYKRTYRLESKTGDIMSRLKQEQDDRQRGLDDIRFQLNLKERAGIEEGKAKSYNFCFNVCSEKKKKNEKPQ